jgi:glycosyltransferase involved in cell wall biosynthesis
MILLDAVFINNSGGKILLDYLIEELEKSNLTVFYLLDRRIFNNHKEIKSSNTVRYLEGSLIKRHLFYRDHKQDFTKVLCFANLPPTIRLEVDVFTYFHQLLFLQVSSDLDLYKRCIFRLKSFVFRNLVRNSNFWLVQSTQMKRELTQVMKNISDQDVMVLPFYPPLVGVETIKRKVNSFLYVSGGEHHKNQNRLIESFCLFYDRHKKGELNLTIGDEFNSLAVLIEELRVAGYPIVNHGFLGRRKLSEIYRSSEFVIYPSLAESFGLGIIEGIESGCKIIGADRPYLYAVCEPSGVFDPESIPDMTRAMEKAAFEPIEPTEQLISNEIKKLINLLN